MAGGCPLPLSSQPILLLALGGGRGPGGRTGQPRVGEGAAVDRNGDDRAGAGWDQPAGFWEVCMRRSVTLLGRP